MSVVEPQPGVPAEKPSRLVLERAAEWLVRLNDGDATEEDFIAWQAWLAERPEHEQAFHEMQVSWQRSASLTRVPARTDPALRAMRQELASVLNAPRRRRAVVMRWTAIAAMLVMTIAGFATWWRQVSNTVETTTAELRSVRLPDGSRAALGPETHIELAFSAHARVLTMTAGEAYFEVVHVLERPFIINTRAGRIIAVGTAFSVHATGDRVAVSVTQGTVRFEPSGSANPVTPVMVSVGQRLIRDRVQTELEPLSSPGDALAWQRGRLEYQGEPLSLVIADINRYSSVKLRIDDPVIGELRYSGTVFPDALDAWLASIDGVFPVQVDKLTDHQLVIRAKAVDRPGH